MIESGDQAAKPLSYRMAVAAASIAPRPALEWAADAAGFAQYWLSGARRRDYLANTGAALAAASCPPWKAFQSHALNVLELLRAAGDERDRFLDRMTVHGTEIIDTALERGRGLVLATFHSGNWELAGLLLARRGYAITTVAGEQLRPGWSDQVKALKKRYGINVAGKGAGIRSLYRDARSNRVIVLHLDGDLVEGGIDAPLLGRTVKAPRGPGRLSRSVGSQIAFAYCRRTSDKRLEVIVEPASDPPANDEEEARLARILMARVEKSVLEDPGQWCIFRRLASDDD